MSNSLLVLLILFCAAVGFGLGGNQANVGYIVIATIGAIIALQLAYFATLVIDTIHHHH